VSGSPVIHWFRNDLRLSDNPALRHAVRSGNAVIPVFIHDPGSEAPMVPGAASNWWLHQSLLSLDEQLRNAGSRLIVRRGSTSRVLHELLDKTSAEAIFWNRRYEPPVIQRDSAIKSALQKSGIRCESFNGALLHEPWEIRNKSGSPFKVFTPFWRHCVARAVENPLPRVTKPPAPKSWPSSLQITDLGLLPAINWTEGMRKAWKPGEIGARENLKRFQREAFAAYSEGRDLPSRHGTSRLSPHLHFGEISPRQIWHSLRDNAERNNLAESTWRNSQFLAEVGWREFAHHLLYHFPHTVDRPLRPEFEAFPWRKDPAALKAWQRGQTGYPIVDAGMRELWTTGWMHNRVRMIVASFLIKDLLIDWREGAAWFWDTLVDADLAANTLGWQWTAGCGADAAPFFRIFNPVSQGEKFDANGDYVRKWIPELANMPDRWVHQPWEAPRKLRDTCDYPEPIVSHAIAREVALEAFQKIRKSAA